MRIVYLNPCGKLGGAETSLRELLAAIRAAEPAWDLWLVLGEDGPLAEIARNLGVHVLLLPFPPGLARLGDAGGGLKAIAALLKAAIPTVGYAYKLRGRLRRLGPDIVHTNGFKMHLLGAWTRPSSKPVVWHIHDYVGSRRLMSSFLRLFRRSCTVAIANSKSVACDLESLFQGMRIVPIYNAVDLQRFSPSGKKLDLDSAAGLGPAPACAVRVGLVSTFARWKGHMVFLEALARLSANVPVRGYVIGAPIYQTDGSQRTFAELKEAADRLGLGGKVGFTGFVEDTAAAVRGLDIVVHASTQPEPFGMVIIEAMACGRAVIASQAGGAAELIEDGRNALAHPPGDAAVLAQQIERLAQDPGLRARLGAAGRASAERSYTRDRLAKQLVAVYREIHAEPAGERPEPEVQDSLPVASN